MPVSLSVAGSVSTAYAVPARALRRWASERLRTRPRCDGGTVYTFALSGSTCGNRPLDVIMTVSVDPRGRIESATSEPEPGDTACAAMCGIVTRGVGARRFFEDVCHCDEAVGLTLAEAAFRDWRVEPSGCFCTAGNRRHKWRNVFQTLHYAVVSGERPEGPGG